MKLLPFNRAKKHKGNQRNKPKQARQWFKPRYIGLAMSLLILLVPMVWAYSALHDAEQFPIRHIEIEEMAFHYLDKSEIGVVAQPYLTAGFFNLDVAALQRAIGEMAWVDRVSVRRVWPDTLRVQVTEQMPLAHWRKSALLNLRGELFVPEGKVLPERLVRLSGPNGQERAVAEMYQRMATSLAPIGLVVEQLAQNERRSWSLVVDNGIEFELGRVDPYARLQRFIRVYPRLMAGQDAAVGNVDLRYSNGFAVSWKGTTDLQKSGS